MRKNFRKISCPLFCPKTSQSLKKILTSFFIQNVAHKTHVQFTKPWNLYWVSVLRFMGTKGKIFKNSGFPKIFLKKTHKANFLKFFLAQM